MYFELRFDLLLWNEVVVHINSHSLDTEYDEPPKNNIEEIAQNPDEIYDGDLA